MADGGLMRKDAQRIIYRSNGASIMLRWYQGQKKYGNQ
jgi:hypothetical protein